jgi:hypothetical protein
MSDVDSLVTGPVDGQMLQYDATLSKWINVTRDHLPVFNVLRYGADPTGATDSSPAINAAIEAAGDPTAGGEYSGCAMVFLPAGDYKCLSTITIGNGTIHGKSTVYGVKLVGAASPGMSLTSGVRNVNPVTGYYGAPTRLLAGTPGMVLVKVCGPLPAWGMENLFLDGNNIALDGLREVSAQGGVVANVSIRGFTSAQQRTTTVGVYDGTGASNHQGNRYTKVQYYVNPAHHNAAGIVCEDGGVGSTGDSWGDVWDQCKITFGGVPSAAITNYGVILRNVDNERFNNIYFGLVGWPHFANWPVGHGSIYTIAFHYQAHVNSFGPADCHFDHIDLAAAFLGTSSVVQWGAPTANRNYPNPIWANTTCNGVYPDPGLSGVRWGPEQTTFAPRYLTGSGPANPTTTDIRAGRQVVWKNTTLNEVRVWVNDGGSMKKSAPFA